MACGFLGIVIGYIAGKTNLMKYLLITFLLLSTIGSHAQNDKWFYSNVNYGVGNTLTWGLLEETSGVSHFNLNVGMAKNLFGFGLMAFNTTAQTDSFTANWLGFAPYVNLHWLNKSKINMYSGAGFGMKSRIDSDAYSFINRSINICLIGAHVVLMPGLALTFESNIGPKPLLSIGITSIL